jgi:SNF2 family DNA or RNA helicase
VGGTALSSEELDALAEAKRPLVRMRDRWIVAHPDLIGRLRQPPPRGLTAIDALAAALGGTLTVDDETVAAVPSGSLAAVADRLRAAPRELAEPEGFTGVLRTYQRRGLAWLVEMTALGLGGILADEMGLGKTIGVIALHLHRQQSGRIGPLLVVCPASLLGNWEREFNRFAPTARVRRYHGGARHLDDLAAGEVVLATYGIARRDRETLASVPWDLVVADEAQHAKNPRARIARAMRMLPAGARVALTGTPIENRLSELWAILDWTTPGLLGSLDAFRRDVAVPIERYRDPDATARLARLVHPFVLRRRKADPDVAPELPAKTETDLVVPMSEEQVTLYEAVVRETMAEIAASDGIARRGLVLKLLTALKQICNHPAQYLRQSGPLAGRSGKLEGFDELIDVIVAEGEAVLVFSQYVAMARLLERHLERAGVATLFLHGQVPPRRRDDLVARFQAGEVPVFLLSLRAGGVGLNLTQATHVIHYDRWWNPAVEDQATDRAHRIGQTAAVQIHRLISEGTVEDRIATLIEAKRELAEAVVGTGERWLSELSDDELADLVELRAAR